MSDLSMAHKTHSLISFTTGHNFTSFNPSSWPTTVNRTPRASIKRLLNVNPLKAVCRIHSVSIIRTHHLQPYCRWGAVCRSPWQHPSSWSPARTLNLLTLPSLSCPSCSPSCPWTLISPPTSPCLSSPGWPTVPCSPGESSCPLRPAVLSCPGKRMPVALPSSPWRPCWVVVLVCSAWTCVPWPVPCPWVQASLGLWAGSWGSLLPLSWQHL